jgi:hypothetical protein
MLDELSAIKDQLHKPTFDDKYSADQAIISAEFIARPAAKILTVVFPPWHIPEWFLKRLQKKLLAQDSSVLIYYFNPQILDDDPIKVKNSFEYVALAIAEDVRELQDQKQLTQVNLLGISLGNVALAITAEKLDEFNKIYMVVPGNDLAASLWSGLRTRRLRAVLKQEGYKLDELQKEWQDLAPEAHIDRFKNHTVHIVLARHDKFIPFSYGKKLLDELSAINPKVTYTIRPFGHFMTIMSTDYN